MAIGNILNGLSSLCGQSSQSTQSSGNPGSSQPSPSTGPALPQGDSSTISPDAYQSDPSSANPFNFNWLSGGQAGSYTQNNQTSTTSVDGNQFTTSNKNYTTPLADGSVNTSCQAGPQGIQSNLTANGRVGLLNSQDNSMSLTTGTGQVTLDSQQTARLGAGVHADGQFSCANGQVYSNQNLGGFVGAKYENKATTTASMQGWQLSSSIKGAAQYGAEGSAKQQYAVGPNECTMGAQATGSLGPGGTGEVNSQLTTPNGSNLSVTGTASPGLGATAGLFMSRKGDTTKLAAQGVFGLGGGVGISLKDQDAPGAAKLASYCMNPMSALPDAANAVMQNGPALLNQLGAQFNHLFGH